jgi:hypothetical protein
VRRRCWRGGGRGWRTTIHFGHGSRGCAGDCRPVFVSAMSGAFRGSARLPTGLVVGGRAPTGGALVAAASGSGEKRDRHPGRAGPCKHSCERRSPGRGSRRMLHTTVLRVDVGRSARGAIATCAQDGPASPNARRVRIRSVEWWAVGCARGPRRPTRRRQALRPRAARRARCGERSAPERASSCSTLPAQRIRLTDGSMPEVGWRGPLCNRHVRRRPADRGMAWRTWSRYRAPPDPLPKGPGRQPRLVRRSSAVSRYDINTRRQGCQESWMQNDASAASIAVTLEKGGGSAMERDPVCGMQVDPSKAGAEKWEAA